LDKWLKVSPEVDESNISVSELNNKYFIAFGEGNSYENGYQPGTLEICIVNKNGNFVLNTTKVNYPFGTDSQIIAIDEKTIVWFYVENNNSELKMYKLTLLK